MKILYLVSWYKRPGSPNSGYFFYQLANGMKKHAETVVVLNVHVKFFAIIDRVGVMENHEDNLHEYTIFIPAIIPRWKWLYDKLGRIGASYMLKRIAKVHGNFDIIHVQSALQAASYSEKYIREVDTPVIYTEHSSRILNGDLTKYELKAINVMKDNAHCCFAVSKALCNKLKRYIPEVGVIGNIVDFDECNTELLYDKTSAFTFVCLGTLRKDKGMLELIQAFSKEFDPHEEVKLLIGGEGEYREEIQREINYHPKHNIQLLGEIPHNRVKNLLEVCDCFVLPSRYETFGIVYIEAMACGLPVIATKCGGPEEFVNKTNGILVEVGNEIELMDALRNMVINHNRYDRSNISKEILNQFSLDTVCKKYLAVYKKEII